MSRKSIMQKNMAAFYTTMLLIQPYVRVDIVLIFEEEKNYLHDRNLSLREEFWIRKS